VHYLFIIKRKNKEEQIPFFGEGDERGKGLSYSHYFVKISMRRRRLMEPSLIVAQIFYNARILFQKGEGKRQGHTEEVIREPMGEKLLYNQLLGA
jgi:hypothetical protein